MNDTATQKYATTWKISYINKIKYIDVSSAFFSAVAVHVFCYQNSLRVFVEIFLYCCAGLVETHIIYTSAAEV